jgi:hypothetical protein
VTEIVPVPPPADRAPAVADTDSWIDKMQPIVWLAERIAGTEFVPKSLRDSPAAVAAAVLYGREVGLPPMTALTQTHVIEGKPAMSAEAMRAMVLAAGHDLVIEETTGALCRMKARRRGTEHWTTIQWTIDMARAAGVANKGVWKSYPRQMLQARCTTELVRLVFPDVIHGFRSTEELDDAGEEEQAAIDAATPAPTTKVSRTAKKTAAKKTAAPALPAAPTAGGRPAAPAGPPLPGEDGYDAEPAPEPVSGSSDDGTAASQAEDAGNDSEDEPDTAPMDATSPAAVDTDAARAPEEGGEASEGAGSVQGEVAGNGIPAAVTTGRDVPPGPVTRAQVRMVQSQWSRLGVESSDREERLALTVGLVGREVSSTNDLTKAEATALIDTLAKFKDRAALNGFLDELDAARAQGVDGVSS